MKNLKKVLILVIVERNGHAAATNRFFCHWVHDKPAFQMPRYHAAILPWQSELAIPARAPKYLVRQKV